MSPSLSLKKGQRYVIRHKSPGTRGAPKESCMTYLGDGMLGELQFNARPAAGTQSFPASWIVEVTPVSNDVKHYVNKKLPGSADHDEGPAALRGML